MSRGDRFGSPYDPRNQGKVQRPPTAQERAAQREREQHMLRGCGNPTCPMCNPETATMSSFSLTSAMRRAMDELERSAFRDAASFNFITGDPWATGPAKPATPQPAQPPASYRGAREKVKAWIVAAPEQTFDDIVGNEAALTQLRDAVRAPVEHKALYEAYGLKMPKGALLSGPPGCGKTMFARATAWEMRQLYGGGTEFISVPGSALQSMFIGETERYIREIFAYAREYKAFHGHPLLVFMDEAEVLLPDRTGRVRRLASWEESQVATFLAEMDGIQESGAFVLLATNRPEVIDQAVLRDGRCDFKIVVQRPTAEALEVILRRNFEGVPLAEGVERDALVFAAVESFLDPGKVIMEARTIGVDLGAGEVFDVFSRHFLFEHIVSGAMAAGVPARAKRYAFGRDKAAGTLTGVTVDDVVASVTDLYQENKGLEHSFALEEFKRAFLEEAKPAIEKEIARRMKRKSAD